MSARFLLPKYTRFIQSIKNMTHKERTKDNYRSNALIDVTITDIRNLSGTVKGYELTVSDKEKAAFLPGQWLDVHIPSPSNDESIVGGYSITSSPNEFIQMGKLGLAIQYSDHPPTDWMHTKCTVGTRMKVRVGGDFFYDPAPHNLSNLLLIAGGIGINPILSVLKHQCFLLRTGAPSNRVPNNNALLYSTKNMNELIFKKEIDQISTGIFKCQYHCTRESPTHPDIRGHRISESDIRDAVMELKSSNIQCYVCGPPPFINYITQTLVKCSIDEAKIHYEKWW